MPVGPRYRGLKLAEPKYVLDARRALADAWKDGNQQKATRAAEHLAAMIARAGAERRGKLGGAAKSKAKSAAARANGRKGGRPRKGVNRG